MGLNLVVGPCALGLVLGGEGSSELGAALLGVSAEVGNLLVPGVHGILEVLAGLLGVLLDLGGVGSDVLVHGVDTSVGGRGPRVGSLLPGGHSNTQVVGGLLLVVSSDLKGGLVALEGGLVPLVLEGGHAGEVLLGALHGVIELLLGLGGV